MLTNFSRKSTRIPVRKSALSKWVTLDSGSKRNNEVSKKSFQGSENPRKSNNGEKANYTRMLCFSAGLAGAEAVPKRRQAGRNESTGRTIVMWAVALNYIQKQKRKLVIGSCLVFISSLWELCRRNAKGSVRFSDSEIRLTAVIGIRISYSWVNVLKQLTGHNGAISCWDTRSRVYVSNCAKFKALMVEYSRCSESLSRHFRKPGRRTLRENSRENSFGRTLLA